MSGKHGNAFMQTPPPPPQLGDRFQPVAPIASAHTAQDVRQIESMSGRATGESRLAPSDPLAC